MKNPLFYDDAGDPYVLKDGEDYYLVPTCKNPQLGRHVFQCYHSRDLQHWSQPKTILDLDDVSWAKEKAWAPTMAKVGDHYYFCFCADQQIGIAVSNSPMGAFRDILGRPLVAYEQYGFQTIDPCFFVDDDGRVYLVFGQGKCYFVEMKLTPHSAEFIGEPISLSDHFYWQSSRNENTFDITLYNEAPDLIKVNGRYLLSWSIYDVRDPRYRVRYAWADRVEGPYIQPVDENGELDNILLRGEGERLCTGHACITEYKGELYIFYGRYKMPRQGYSREICCDKVEFLDEFRLRAMPSK